MEESKREPQLYVRGVVWYPMGSEQLQVIRRSPWRQPRKSMLLSDRTSREDIDPRVVVWIAGWHRVGDAHLLVQRDRSESVKLLRTYISGWLPGTEYESQM